MSAFVLPESFFYSKHTLFQITPPDKQSGLDYSLSVVTIGDFGLPIKSQFEAYEKRFSVTWFDLLNVLKEQAEEYPEFVLPLLPRGFTHHPHFILINASSLNEIFVEKPHEVVVKLLKVCLNFFDSKILVCSDYDKKDDIDKSLDIAESLGIRCHTTYPISLKDPSNIYNLVAGSHLRFVKDQDYLKACDEYLKTPSFRF